MYEPKDFGFTNKYLRAYFTLCSFRALSPCQDEITEWHHVYPVSIFGKNKQTVKMSLREHFVAHRLLQKSYKRNYGEDDWRTIKMSLAVHHFLSNGRIKTSKNFSQLREEFIRASSANMKKVAANMTFEQRSERSRSLWQNAEFIAARKQGAADRFSRPEEREKLSQSRLRFYEEHPEAKEAVGEHFRSYYAENDEARQQARDRLTSYRDDPDVRAKIKATLGSEEHRKRNSQTMKKKLAEDLDYRAKAIAALARGRDSDENRARQSELIKSQQLDPEFQQKRVEALRRRQEEDAKRGKRIQLCDPVTKQRKRVFPDTDEYKALIEAGWTDMKSAGIPGPNSRPKS